MPLPLRRPSLKENHRATVSYHQAFGSWPIVIFLLRYTNNRRTLWILCGDYQIIIIRKITIIEICTMKFFEKKYR